jgi:hypothetical protein
LAMASALKSPPHASQRPAVTRPRASPSHQTTKAAKDRKVMIVAGSLILSLRRSIGQSMNALAANRAAVRWRTAA